MIIQLAAAMHKLLTSGTALQPPRADAVGKNRICQNGRRCCSVANHFAGLFGCLPKHASTEIFLWVLKIEFLGAADLEQHLNKIVSATSKAVTANFRTMN
jgi:hypothetical protein